MTVRLAVVTDIHHGAPSQTKRGDTALQLLQEFCLFANNSGASHVLDLGDRISDLDRETDLRLEREVSDGFRALKLPVWHINGNHDREYLSVAENEQILGQSLGHEAHDIGGWRILIWRANTKFDRSNGMRFVLPDADFLWLAGQILRADRPVLLISHVPLSGHAQTGNYYFEAYPELSTYPEAGRIRAALALARVPVTCLAGHVHWNTITSINGITHLTQQSLTESFTTGGEPAAAMGILELGEQVRWEVAGADPFVFSMLPEARRWIPPRSKV